MEEHFYQTQSFKKKVPIYGLILLFLIFFWPEIRIGIWSLTSFIRIFILQQIVEAPSFRETIQVLILYSYCVLNFGIIFVLLLFLISQFILPVHRFSERWNVFTRLFSYSLGLHGLALFVKEGKFISQKGEIETRKNPGVILVDSNSAVIVEKPKSRLTIHASKSKNQINETSTKTVTKTSSRIRIHGPGIIFTEYRESPRGVADLRPQLRFRSDVHALTRDGIEITTNISTVFTIGQTPDVLKVGYVNEKTWENIYVVNLTDKPVQKSGSEQSVAGIRIAALIDELDEEDKEEIHKYIHSISDMEPPTASPHPSHKPKHDGHYHLDPERVFAAVYSKAQDFKKGEYLEWTELPPYTAAEIFRNMLSHEVYEYLYSPEDAEKFPLLDLKTNFSRRVRNLGVLAYQFVQNWDGSPLKAGQEWLEDKLIFYPVRELKSPKVLRSRGIKVLFAGFSDLKPVDPKVRETLLTHWRAHWKRDVELTRADYDLQAMRVRSQARAQAQREMTHRLAEIFKTAPHSQEALAIRVYQALEKAASDPATHKLLPADTIKMLENLQKLLIPEDQNSPPDSLPEEKQPEHQDGQKSNE